MQIAERPASSDFYAREIKIFSGVLVVLRISGDTTGERLTMLNAQD